MLSDREIAARRLGVRQLFERHFGTPIRIETIRPLPPLPSPDTVTPEPSEPRQPVMSANAVELAAVHQLLGDDCKRCTLCRGRRNVVFGVGNPDADLVVIGEAPGAEEDKQGEPFVGRAGEMLDKMLAGVLGLDRSQVYILNVIKCRPPGNRDPFPQEVESCLPFLQMQLEAIQPRLILLMGTVALRALFGTQHGVTAHRGEWMSYQDIPVMPTFHPAYLLRRPEGKRSTFEDLKALKRRYDELMGRPVDTSTTNE